MQGIQKVSYSTLMFVVSALHLVIIPEMQALPNFVSDERHLANRQNLFSF